MATFNYGLPSVPTAPGPVQPLSFGPNFSGGISNFGNQGSFTVPSQQVAPNNTQGGTSASAPPASSAMPDIGQVTRDIVRGADPTTMPGAEGGGGFLGGLGQTFMNEDGSFNLGNIGSLAQTIGAFGNMWNGFQANNIARDAMSFQTRAYDTNLANQTQSYNTALEDRITTRYHREGRSSGAADRFIATHRLGD